MSPGKEKRRQIAVKIMELIMPDEGAILTDEEIEVLLCQLLASFIAMKTDKDSREHVLYACHDRMLDMIQSVGHFT